MTRTSPRTTRYDGVSAGRAAAGHKVSAAARTGAIRTAAGQGAASSAPQTEMVRTLFAKRVANERSDRVAGPFWTAPLVLNRDPWHGQT